VQFQRLDELGKNLLSFIQNFLALRRQQCLALVGKLEALGPVSVLKRGFSVTLKLPGEKIVVSASQVQKGDQIKTKLAKGYLISEIRETMP
jgi:exodeoxyribonuclease VII large subunit